MNNKRFTLGFTLVEMSVGGVNSGGLCSGSYYIDIIFTNPFTSPPHVLVAPSHISGQAGCVGNTTDTVVAKAQNITANGFRLFARSSVSP